MRHENSGWGSGQLESAVQAGFWSRALRLLPFAGKQLIHKALLLHYAAQNPRTPKWAKTAIYGALVYLLSPLDLIPDLLPAVGYTDDLWVLAAAVATVTLYINDDVQEQAARRLQAWFGPEGVASS